MDLLDSDSEIIEKNNEKKPKKKSGRKAKNSGLNRFASSLNKYKKLTDEHRKKQEAASDNEGIKRTQPAKPKKVMSNEQPSTPPNELKPENETVNNEKKTTHKSQPAKPKIAKSTKQPHEDTFKDESLTIEPSETYKDETSTKETFITNELKGNKEVTNKPQMDNQLEYKEITNKPQMDNQKVTKGVQRGNSTDNKTDNVSANFTSPTALTDNDPRLLMGQNKKLLEIFFADCKSTGSLTTGRFTREYISNALNTTPNQVKTVLNRLVKRGFVERLPGKRGRAGWVQIQIPQDIYEQLIYMENSSSLSRVNDEMLVNKITKGITERVTNPSSSSSNLNNNLTTTTKPLPEEWQFIQIPDVLKENGFSMAHIKQLYGDHFLSSDEVQDSLDAFAFDLSE